MIETETTWDDSGYDCDHCGGRILQRTDYETGQPPRVCYQCEACGCQWTLSGDTLRVGGQRECRLAAKKSPQAARVRFPRWVFIVALIVVFLFLLRFGGFLLIRLLLPLALVGFIAWSLMRFGREQEWW